MVKKLLYTFLGIALVFPVIALGQNSSLWKFTGYLEPVVSSWGLKIPSLTSCSLSTDGNGVVQCGGGSSGGGGGNVSATGSTTKLSYFVGPHSLSGSDIFWTDSTKTLELPGTYSGTTIIGSITDTGGQVCNVEAYGAIGDNATDNYAAIQSAIDNCTEGGIVYFPPGIYRISQEIRIDRRNTTIMGTHAPRWFYRAGSPTSIKAAASFSGTSLIHVRENTLSGQANTNDGGRILNIGLDGNDIGSNVAGIYFEGLVRDWTLENVDISHSTFDGFRSTKGSGTGYPRGFTVRRVSVHQNARHGFRGDSLTDSYIEDLLAVDNDQRGIYLSTPGETKLVSSRAVFNDKEGLYIDGSNEVNGMQIDGFSTDRNGYHGIRISITGTGTISMSNIMTNRDGNVAGPETNAGISITGSDGAGLVVPIVIDGLVQTVGVGDDGSGTRSPEIGVSVGSGTYVKIGGQFWGITSAYQDRGDNNFFFIEEDSMLKTGYGSTETSSIYNAKWVLTGSGSDGLIEYPGTASGRKIHSEGLLTSSGGGIIEGNITMNSPTSPSTLQLLLNSDSAADYASVVRWKGETNAGFYQGGYMQYDAANNEFILGVHDAGNASTSSDIEVFQFSRDGSRVDLLRTLSGTTINLYGSLTASGTVAFDSSSIYLNSFANCTSLETVGGLLTCGTDAGTDYTVGQGLTLNGGVISLSTTHSGSSIRAVDYLSSSGSIAVEKSVYIDGTKFGSGTRLATYVVDAGGGGDFTDIQSAIDALPSGGGKVFVKKGNYSLSTKLLIKQSNTTIEGEAFGVTIQCDGAVTRTCVGVNGINYFQISVKNLSITQTNATKQGNGLDMSDVALAFVDNVRISNFGTGAMLKDLNNNTFYSHYENLVLFDNINCLFIGGTESNMNYFENVRCRPSVGDSGTGIIIKDSRGLTFTNFDMEPTTAGTIAGFDIDATSRNITFINPWIEQNGLGGYIAAGAVRTTFIGGTFSSNTRDIVDLGTDTSFMNTNIFGVATTHFGAASMSGAVNMSSTLNIGGNLQMIDSDTRSEIILDNTNGNGDSLLNLRFPGAAQWLVGMDDDDNDNFKIDDGSSLDTSPRFMIDHAGSVGINTNIAKSKLTVFGSGAFTGSMSGANILVQSGGYIRGRLALGKTTAAEALDVNGNILSNSTIYIDSTGTSTFRSDRGATTNFASYILTTAGVDQWSMQTRNDSTNDFYLQDTLNGRTPLKIIQSSGLVKVKFGLSGSTLFAQDSLTSSGSFVYEGAGSGASLTVSNGFRGSGLADCDTASSAVTWDITTSRFGCNSITAGVTAGQGITVAGGVVSLTPTHSGTTIKATTYLSSSGALAVESGSWLYNINMRTPGSQLNLGTNTVTGTPAVQIYQPVGTNRFAFDGFRNMNFAIDAGNLTTTATVSWYTNAPDTAGTLLMQLTEAGTITPATLEVIGTGSGRELIAQDRLASSGSLVVDGSTIYFNGFNCSGNTNGGSLTISATGQLSCSDDDGGGSSYGAGQGLTLNGSNFFSLNASHSGSDIWALSSLRSSGSLVVEQGAVFNPSASSVNFDIYGAVNGPLFRVDSGNNDVLISGTTAANSDVIFSAGALGLDSIILNEQSRDADFRIESNDNTHAFYLDSGLNRIGIFNSSPLNALDVTGDVHASTGVFSSGSLIVEGTAKIHGTLSGNLIRATISPMVREVRFQSGTMLTGSGFAQFMIPAFASGWNLTAVQFDVRTAGTTNVTSVQLRQLDKNRVMLSTPISIDSGEKTSLTAATPYVINTANDDVHGGQLITVDVTGISSTPPKDPSILLQLTAP